MAFQEAKFGRQLAITLRHAGPKVRRYPKTHLSLSVYIDYVVYRRIHNPAMLSAYREIDGHDAINTGKRHKPGTSRQIADFGR